MRHRKSFNHLGRTASHRKAMLANMASSLIKHKRITTTTAKAKALRTFVEPLITKSKDDTTHSRRVVFSYLQDKDAVSELFREVAGKVADRPGGYTRILKLGNRLGDSAEMAIIELVDYNPNLLGEGAGKAGGRKRRRGSKKKSEAEQAGVGTQVAEIEEAQVVEETESTEQPSSDVSNETSEPVAETEVAETESAEVTDEVKDESAKDESAEEGEKSNDTDEEKQES